MTRLLPLFIGALIMLALATLVLVALPYHELRAVQAPEALAPYTAAQVRGRATYVSMGCAYCHSQQPRAAEYGPDAARGWGRPSVPADYAYDDPHQLGVARTGPDLFNIGARQPSDDWQLTHLYQPRAVAPGSVMPSYPFLFRRVAQAARRDTVVNVPPPYAPVHGQIIATQEALDLVAYLISLNHTYPISASDAGAQQ